MRYRSILSIFAYMCLTVAITACQDELDISGGAAIEDYGDSYFIIDTDGMPLSRATYSDINNTVFDEGDIVGVFGLDGNDNICDGEENIPYSVNVIAGTLNPDGTIAPSTKRSLKPATDKEVKKNRTKYLFYYPYQKDMTFADIQNLKHSVATDQRPAEEETGKNKVYENSDLLWDIAVPESGGKYCHVRMDHAMANIIVIVDETNYAPDKGVVINGVNITAKGINLMTDGIDNLAGTYTTDTPTDGLNMWGFNYDAGGSRQFRLAVPAQTIKAEKGKNFISVQYGKSDKDGNVTYQNKTFNLNKDLVMKPGYNYIFRLSTRPLPIPDYDEEDSWVLDVLDPETGEQIGLLCREYIRYQPQNTLTGNNFGIDQITFPFEKGVEPYPEGINLTTPGANPSHLEGVTMSSQAWVFYNMDGNSPNLERGQILRVIYDVRYHTSGNYTAMGAWPFPYKVDSYYSELNNSGSSHSFYLSAHGHDWVCADGFGRSTTDNEKGAFKNQSYYEFWDVFQGESDHSCYYTMHGSWIWWCPEHNLIYDFKLYDGKRVSNQVAYEYGHIAIPNSGNPFVSFAAVSENNPIKDNEGNKVGFTVPHYLIDSRTTQNGKTEIKRYPLVKIGYNQFWMSRSLSAKHLNDKYNTQLIDYSGVSKQNNPYSVPGYILPEHYQKSTDPDKTNWDVDLLYNTKTVLTEGFAPVSQITGEKYIIPTAANLRIMWDYLGWHAFSKFITGDVIASQDPESYKLKGKNPPKSKDEALARGFFESNNGICVNVSGFNIKSLGYFHLTPYSWIEGAGAAAAIILDPEDDTKNTLAVFQINNYHHSGEYGQIVKNAQQANDRQDESNQTLIFAPVRLFMRFSPQDNKKCEGHSRPSLHSDAPTAIPTTRSRSVSGSVSRNVYVELMSD